jgi:GNAT superfamily N-acetyltransferase
MQPQPARTWTREGYVISTDRARIDLDVVHRFLSTESYWAQGIPRELVARSIEHAQPFGLYQGETMVGFARVITDFATVGYLGDVFVLPGHRGRGLSKRRDRASYLPGGPPVGA